MVRKVMNPHGTIEVALIGARESVCTAVSADAIHGRYNFTCDLLINHETLARARHEPIGDHR